MSLIYDAVIYYLDFTRIESSTLKSTRKKRKAPPPPPSSPPPTTRLDVEEINADDGFQGSIVLVEKLSDIIMAK